MPEGIREKLDLHGWAIMPEDYHPNFTPRDAHLPESRHIVIQEQGFYWEAVPNDSHVRIDTSFVDKEVLKQLM